MDNGIRAGEQLLEKFNKEEKAWHLRKAKIRRHHSGQLFSKAYYLRDKSWLDGMTALLHSFFMAPNPIHLKLAIKYLIPMRWPAQISARRESDDA
ncbi:MAG: hypothetical protein B7Y33_00495 [Hydrogenophilales bacterium 16-62-9]|nr:MAG: hypothetical protein B7Y33_00495 [Hydrogenophilales bacterium 16-62-9]